MDDEWLGFGYATDTYAANRLGSGRGRKGKQHNRHGRQALVNGGERGGSLARGVSGWRLDVG